MSEMLRSFINVHALLVSEKEEGIGRADPREEEVA